MRNSLPDDIIGQAQLQPESLYLDLLKQCLTRSAFPERLQPLAPPRRRVFRAAYVALAHMLASREVLLARRRRHDSGLRHEGRDLPAEAETMIGHRRLDNLEQCITRVLRDRVPGDLIEAGTWRGGAAILMRATLAAYGDNSRVVWVADSFQGVPQPDPEHYPADVGDRYWTIREVAVSLEEVKSNFARYGLLDERVRFLPGWFRDTLPIAPIEQLCLLRLDGDLYESTIQTLDALYPKLAPGGFLIIDDYGAVPGCARAVDDYRARHGITEDLEHIDWTGRFWRKPPR